MSVSGKDKATAAARDQKQQTEPTLPAQSRAGQPANRSSDADVSAFVARLQTLRPGSAGHNGRLIFAMDATMSRQPTWDMALALQADMFHAVTAIGGLNVQLVYFRGPGGGPAPQWVAEPEGSAWAVTRVAPAGRPHHN